jgi:hypothetical protein
LRSLAAELRMRMAVATVDAHARPGCEHDPDAECPACYTERLADRW